MRRATPRGLNRILGAYNSGIGKQGRLGLFSAHKAAEDVYMRLLNELYGWSFANGNAPGRN